VKKPQSRPKIAKQKKFDPYGVRHVFAFFLLLTIPLYFSNISPDLVTIKLCSTSDGNLVCGVIKLIDKAGNKTSININRQDSLRLPYGDYKIEVETPGFETPETTNVSIKNSLFHELNIGVVPSAQIFGIALNGITNGFVSGIDVELRKGDKVYKSATDTQGIYNISLPEGEYTLLVNNPNFLPYENKIFLKSGISLNREVYLLPADLSSIPLSEYVSYSLFGQRNGNISGFKQIIESLNIKKNLKNEYLITQKFNTDWTGGELNIVLKDGQGYYSEGSGYKLFDIDGLSAAKLMVKTQEDLWTYMLRIRQDKDSVIKPLGNEKANNVDCKKFEVSNTVHNWMGKSVFEFTTWEIAQGRLSSMPTRIKGRMRGWDEYGHGFDISFDLSVTDVSLDFKMPEVDQ
jgi:hypothetical protein